MAIKKQADYWALANYVVDPVKLIAVGTYGLWGSEGAYKAGEPIVTTIQCQSTIDALDGMEAVSAGLELAALTGPLKGGTVIK